MVSRAVERVGVGPGCIAHQGLRDGSTTTELLGHGFRYEDHREAAGGGDDLLLTLRGKQVLGRQRHPGDRERRLPADAECRQRVAGRDVEVVGGVLLDDRDRRARGGRERRDRR